MEVGSVVRHRQSLEMGIVIGETMYLRFDDMGLPPEQIFEVLWPGGSIGWVNKHNIEVVDGD